MKTLFFIALSTILIGCAGSSGGSDTPKVNNYADYAGSFLNTADMTTVLTVNSSGQFTDSTCGYVASFSLPNQSHISNLLIASTNGTPGCMASTTHVCQIYISEPYLMIDCGAPHQYQFQRQ